MATPAVVNRFAMHVPRGDFTCTPRRLTVGTSSGLSSMAGPKLQMPSPTQLRTATPADAPAVARLINLAFRVEDFFKAGDRTSPEGVTALMNKGEFLVLDGDDGLPVVAVYVTRING